jgi:hypothetical protein
MPVRVGDAPASVWFRSVPGSGGAAACRCVPLVPTGLVEPSTRGAHSMSYVVFGRCVARSWLSVGDVEDVPGALALEVCPAGVEPVCATLTFPVRSPARRSNQRRRPGRRRIPRHRWRLPRRPMEARSLLHHRRGNRRHDQQPRRGRRPGRRPRHVNPGSPARPRPADHLHRPRRSLHLSVRHQRPETDRWPPRRQPGRGNTLRRQSALRTIRQVDACPARRPDTGARGWA